MIETLAKTQTFALAKRYEWRDKFGNFHKPEEMETRHIVHVVSMIWNHTMPEEARTHNYQRYVFGTFYSNEYMEVSVKFLIKELFARDDLETWMKQRIRYMTDYLFRMRLITPQEIDYQERKLL